MADKVFTLAELAQYDGQDGRPAYFAYEGQVYDASSIPNWKENKNHGNLAGKDITDALKHSPHGAGVIRRLASGWYPRLRLQKRPGSAPGLFLSANQPSP